MTIPGIRLAVWSVYWRAAALVFVLAETRLWMRVRRWNVPSTWHTLRPFVRKSPGYLAFALGAAVLVTLGAALLVRLVIGPQLRRWLGPRTEPTHAFHLAPREAVAAESPARRVGGRSCPPGTLVVTNLRLWFFPTAWDVEPWAVPLESMQEARAVPAPPILGGLVTGVPDRIEVLGTGRRETFVVADPDQILAWFEAARVAPGRLPA
jgi:hypothetical protein